MGKKNGIDGVGETHLILSTIIWIKIKEQEYEFGCCVHCAYVYQILLFSSSKILLCFYDDIYFYMYVKHIILGFRLGRLICIFSVYIIIVTLSFMYLLSTKK